MMVRDLVRDALLSWLGVNAARAVAPPRLPPSSAVAESVHSEAVHALNNRTAATLSGFERQKLLSGRVTRSLGLGEWRERAIQEVNDDAERLRSIVGGAFKE